MIHIPTGASLRFEFIERALGKKPRFGRHAGRLSQVGRTAAASWEEQLRHVRELADALDRCQEVTPASLRPEPSDPQRVVLLGIRRPRLLRKNLIEIFDNLDILV